MATNVIEHLTMANRFDLNELAALTFWWQNGIGVNLARYTVVPMYLSTNNFGDDLIVRIAFPIEGKLTIDCG